MSTPTPIRPHADTPIRLSTPEAPISTRQAILQQVPIFAGLSDAAVEIIARAVEERTVRAGDIVVREGEPGNRMFIILSGRLEVVKHLGGPRETVLDVLQAKNFLGEMSMVDSVSRSASVRALEESRLFSLKGIDLYHLFKQFPEQYAIVILNIARDLARRLRAIDEKFAAISH
jgi:CRP/FNR family transcriptional regulator, cyclic AMP receptor protein